MSATLPRDWDLRRMPWLHLVDQDGHTVHLSVIAHRAPAGPASIQVVEDGQSAEEVLIELDSISDAERTLSLIESLAGRTWQTNYVGKAS